VARREEARVHVPGLFVLRGGFLRPVQKSTRAVKECMTEKGVSCSSGLLRISLKKIVDEGQLSPTGRGRARVYSRTGEQIAALLPVESSEAAFAASETSFS